MKWATSGQVVRWRGRSERRGVGAALAVVVVLAAAGVGPAHAGAAPVRNVPQFEDADVTLAKLGVTLFMIEHLASPQSIQAPCPVIRDDQLNYFLGGRGMTPNMTGYSVHLATASGLDIPTIECGVDVVGFWENPDPAAPHAAFVSAMNIDGEATFADVLAGFQGSTVINGNVPVIGGEIGGFCLTQEPALCAMHWHRDGLVVTLGLAGPSAQVTQNQAVEILAEMIPTVIESLSAAGSPSGPTTVPTPTVPASTSTTPAAASTLPAPATSVPASTAPASTAAAVSTVPVFTAAVPTVAGSTLPAPTVSAVSTVSPVSTVSTASTVPTSAPTSASASTVASGPSTVAGAPSVPDVAAARATLADFLANNPVGTDVGVGAGIVPVCPASSVESLQQQMTAAGLVPNVADFRVIVEEATAAPGLLAVVCGGDFIVAAVSADPANPSQTATVQMFDVTGVATIEQVLAERSGLTLTQSNVPGIGGDIYGAPCGITDPGAICIRLWHREGLVVLLQIGGTSQPGLDQSVDAMFPGLVSEIVTDLATNANWPTPTGQ